MTDRTRNRRHLIAAGFIETSPGNFERQGVLIQYSANLSPAFRVMAPHSATHAAFNTENVRQALLAAALFGDLEKAAGAVISEATATAAVYMTDDLPLDLGRGISPDDMKILEIRAQHLLSSILEAAMSAGRLPTDELELADDPAPEEPKAARWLTTVRAKGAEDYSIRTGALHHSKAEAEAEGAAIMKGGFYRSLPVEAVSVEPFALPYYATVSPSYYKAPEDSGYTWEGMATGWDDAVRQALEACHTDNGRPYLDANGERVEGDDDRAHEEPHTTDPDDPMVTVHICEPDFKALGVMAVSGQPGSTEALRAALEIAGALS